MVALDNSSSPISGVFNEGSSSSSPSPKKNTKKMSKFDYSKAEGLPNTVLEKIHKLGGDGVVLIIQKTLRATDLNDHHGRVSLPKSEMNPSSLMFLNPVEREYLNSDGDKNGRAKMVVGFIEPSGKMNEITLGTWKVGENKDKTMKRMYNLMHTWNDVVKENKLKAGRLIQLWAFRVQFKLWFALVPV
ncbi:putative B3 domain-containing protein At3g49610 [Impatiens glandulifera]|uniref:putative B3 domain-containing protein At3g49610 n=1 Tax=Impatiens glandulifera TaxID=253017 RepID=UPI001FB11571|nr:putative B3 domain-containing protein At3g49610 [Impatiens glandulifera]